MEKRKWRVTFEKPGMKPDTVEVEAGCPAGAEVAAYMAYPGKGLVKEIEEIEKGERKDGNNLHKGEA